jgi:exopolysaccharide production protein ExoZ
MKLNSIQFLRAIAALGVVVYHYLVGNPYIASAGVDIFFVVSGFIMGTVAMDAAPRAFLYSRLVRIVPLYWGVTLFLCVGSMVGVFSNFTFNLEQLWKSLLFVPYADATGFIAPLLVVGWTLNLEMLFYAVFAIGLSLRAPFLFTIAVLSVLVLIGQIVPFSSAVMRSWTSTLLIEFMAGLLLSQLHMRSGRAGIAAIALSIIGFALAQWHGENEALRVLLLGVPAFLAVSGCLWLEKSGRWPSRLLSPFNAVGDASYALYLIHGIVISFVHKLVAPGVVGGMLSVVLATIASVIVHKLVEKPLIAFLKKIPAFCVRRLEARRPQAGLETV